MNRKGIEGKLSSVLTDWINSLPKPMQQSVRNSVVLTGGSIVSLFQDDTPKDYDLYFSEPSVAKLVAEHYAHIAEARGYRVRDIRDEPGRLYLNVNSQGFLKLEAPSESRYYPVCFTSNAISLTNKIQLIMRFCGSPEDIHKNFDFTHCKNYLTLDLLGGGHLYTNPEAIECILSKELKYSGSRYPLASIIRTRKFIQRGWTINAGQYLKMAMQLREYDLKDPHVLMDQLMGVDASYFYQILSLLKEGEGLRSGSIDQSYLFDLVNKFF